MRGSRTVPGEPKAAGARQERLKTPRVRTAAGAPVAVAGARGAREAAAAS